MGGKEIKNRKKIMTTITTTANTMKTIIGKTYIASDNSYSKNLTTKTEHYLAGTAKDNPKEAIIQSEPFQEIVTTCVGKLTEQTFVIVNYKGDSIMVLYSEKNVERDLLEAIARNSRIHSCW